MINPSDRRLLTVKYMTYCRLTGSTMPYHKYLMEYQFTPSEKAHYQHFYTPFIKHFNLLVRILQPKDLMVIPKIMKKRIAMNKLPQEYLVFLREYHSKPKKS